MDRFYGDDCFMEDLIAYFCVGISDAKVDSLVKEYRGLKKDYGIPENAEAHAKIMFHTDQRSKSAFSHMNIVQIKNFVTKALLMSAEIGLLKPTIAVADSRLFPQLTEVASFDELKLDPKQVMHILKNACSLEIHGAYEGDQNLYKIYSDKLSNDDSTSKKAIPIGGSRKRSRMPMSYISPDLSRTDDINFKLDLRGYDEAPNKEIYELADMFLYICCKAICAKNFEDKEYFIERLNLILPRRLSFELH